MDKQLASVKNLEIESEEKEKSKLEEVLEELATLHASAETAAEHNKVSYAPSFHVDQMKNNHLSLQPFISLNMKDIIQMYVNI